MRLDETLDVASGQGAEFGPQTGRSPAMSSAREVILAVLCLDLSKHPDDRSELEIRAELVEAALIEHGYLPDPDQAATDVDVDATAKWLAGRSRYPRYVDVEDGWRRLLESDADVERAHHHASLSASQSDQQAIDQARALLLSVLAARRASGAEA